MWIAFANIIFTFITVYALRGVYFALLEETKTPYQTTGITIGLVSFIGFTPDIFFAPITGRILDSSSSIAGFQLYFGFFGNSYVYRHTSNLSFVPFPKACFLIQGILAFGSINNHYCVSGGPHISQDQLSSSIRLFVGWIRCS